MERALAAYPAIARGLVDLFLARFDPALGEAQSDERTTRIEAIEAAIAERAGRRRDPRRGPHPAALPQCASAAPCAPISGRPAPTVPRRTGSRFKIDSRAIDELPAPRPLVEIFVYSPRMEGIHLRGGRVARGGIRWSDRREDFRTEILGLMKTQMVKNAVIVPVGSKGGFYVKRPPAGGTREQVQAEGIACYQTLIRGLLDLTDNYVGGSIVPPANVVRHDGDDPYLVVAADKGTATFSDIANALSRRLRLLAGRRLRLGRLGRLRPQEDGHHRARRLGIGEAPLPRARARTSRRTPFTVVGVGDMSGDVFGNGMLLSRQIRAGRGLRPPPHLHRSRARSGDEPGPSASGCSTCRARPGWTTTGRCCRRAAASSTAPPSRSRCRPRRGALLGIDAPSLTPVELMRAILTAPVDLLYFGGIGTYVKASSESHADAGDRANDALRVDAATIARPRDRRGRQPRLHPARPDRGGAGGRARSTPTRSTTPPASTPPTTRSTSRSRPASRRTGGSAEDRDALLFAMTDEVAALVLRNNYQQSQAISVAEAHGRRGARPAGAASCARWKRHGPARPRRRVPARHRGHARARRWPGSI